MYLARGPWLDADPLLHTAQGPPVPSAWLFDVALHALEQLVGFQGLRVVHALLVAGILWLAWTLLRRASGSPAFASLGTSLFVALSAYRLFQLRPHLLTILFTLLLLRWLLPARVPSWRSVCAVAGLFALWANVHGGFVLGGALLAAAALAQALSALRDASRRARAARLAAALGLAGLATLVNPAGATPHRLYFAAGQRTPALELVRDEWAPVDPFALPVANVPPSPLAFASVWLLLVATPVAAAALLRGRRRGLTLVVLAAVSWVGLLSAVRLLWLGLVPLLLIGRSLQGVARRPALRWGTGVVAALLLPAFVGWGDWPMISRGVRRGFYQLPFAVSKHDAHAVWFLRDAGLAGNLWNDYASGDFLGYWLAPRLREFVNGSLNVPPGVMEAGAAIEARSGAGGRSFPDLLDAYRIDVFFGTGLPVYPATKRVSTTTHLEGEPGWLTVFRSVRSAVYLRRNERNAANLARVAAYYAREGVPFDPEAGFDPERAIERAPRWAMQHGIAPFGLARTESAAGSLDPSTRGPAQERLALLHALLGDYERSVAVDRRRLEREPDALPARRRLVWCLLHEGRAAESLQAAERLAALAPGADPLSRLLIAAARGRAGLSEARSAALVARLPLLGLREEQAFLYSFLSADARAPRTRAHPQFRE